MNATISKPTDIVGAIHLAYEGLSSREKEVADHVLAAPGDISMYPGSELAARVGVSNSTITRFVKRVGFESYEEMRLAAREARQTGSPLFTESHAADAAENGVINRFADAEAACLRGALADLSHDRVQEIVSALLGARQVAFMGFRNSHFLASYARRLVFQFRSGTSLIPSSPGESIAERIADLGKDDLAVVVAMRRTVRPMRSYVEALQKAGVRILLVTDPSVRILPTYAEWTISCPVENPHVFDSYAGSMAVLRLIAFEAFQRSGAKGRAHLARIEAVHEGLDELS
ncbi:MurR/RpiR family transcriptional regulator [Limimaricola pyoseonensis]|uniref:DNA-binding transcriptional regulator, MurR/RpiR family, contains HTH and SIS domains n=1 Tax=Limimaricola pyoseonensis TaxID=521013 RepID=A0A1G7BVK4_9RHOB|nr:MurR/RpiR family transcriptional regulator [Limimaricola pyoseonensis]SDE31161.1 DNA-binding transcriptional regulator, MurR/RpiR family, contains HTH and SIS domains [Limimaricola pyoseonensis]